MRPVGAFAGAPGVGQIHLSRAAVEHPDSGHRVDDDPVPVRAVERLAPLCRLVPVHPLEQARGRLVQLRLHLAGELEGLRDRPLGEEAGVHHRKAVLVMHQLLPAEPVEQLPAVGLAEDPDEGVAAPRPRPLARLAVSDGEQVQVVIAENDDGAIAEAPRPPQHPWRVGSAIDEVTGEPDAIPRAIERGHLEEALQRPVAALDVAYSVRRHRASPRASSLPSRRSRHVLSRSSASFSALGTPVFRSHPRNV